MLYGIYAQVNRPYPRRVQLCLGSLQGPLSSPAQGDFDPGRDLRVYNGGELKTIESSAWDGLNNRYLMFLTTDLDFDLPTQVIHHIPSPPFEVESNPTLLMITPGQDPDILAGGSVTE